MSYSPAADEVAATKLSPADSIQNDKVICLECGAEMKQLTSKHLVSHGMNPKEYKKKYGFYDEDAIGRKVIDQSEKQSGEEEGIA